MVGVTRRARLLRFLAGLMGAAAILAVPTACATEHSLKVMKVEEARVAFPEASNQSPILRMDRPYFDADSRLRWDDAVFHGLPGGCDPARLQAGATGPAVPVQRNRLRSPRVNERRCPRVAGRAPEATLVGIDGTGAVSWQRSLAFPSGTHALDQRLIGASPEGLVLSSLEVWSPFTGETVVPARTHPVGPDARPVPDHQFESAALYDPRRRRVLVFDAEVTLLRHTGGLHRFDPATGSMDLLEEVSMGWLGAYDRVEAMVLSPDGNYLFLARQRSFRGPGFVSLEVFDMEARRAVFEARHGEGHSCSDPQVVSGPSGHIGFAYRDASTGHHVLVHYRMGP